MPAMLLDFLPQWAGDIEADHTDSGIVIDCADRNTSSWRLMRRANNNNNMFHIEVYINTHIYILQLRKATGMVENFGFRV